MSEPRVRVRFAPSPTGPLHIGGVRTALFNYLFAKKHNGDFLLRIEDTDQTRFVVEAEKYIIDSLKWLKIMPNEGITKSGKVKSSFHQSKRRYKSHVNFLIRNNTAYYAFDTPEELELKRKKFESLGKVFQYDSITRIELKNSLTNSNFKQLIKSGIPYVVRFKMPENVEVEANDMIRGNVKFNTSTLDDKVIFKSDGLPTYHLANIVDDHLMKITHVIRGEEWLPSLPLHVMLYRAFGWEDTRPKFAHLPLILKPSGKGKLSKRDGDKDGFPVFPLEWKPSEGEIASGYRESGYFPEAVVNLLALLGWNPGTEQEIFSLEDLCNSFSLERVNKSGARFDPEKAKWFNQQYIQKKNNSELAQLFDKILKNKGFSKDLAFIEKIVSLVKERIVFVNDLWDQSSYFFAPPNSYDEQAVKKFWKEDTSKIVADCLEILKNTDPFTSLNLEDQIKKYIESNALGFGKVMNPLRIAVVGAAKGPHLFDIFEMIDKEETVRRIEKSLKEFI